ncbi:MAG: mechanosensitive ion channel family protein [Thermoanaerobaculia bacterium]|nr:mechanosensitive ion channel family protein [Thermoanaerobaculia bacterium]
MQPFVDTLRDLLSAERLLALGQALLLLAVGIVLARLVAGAVHRLSRERLEPSQAMLLRRIALYGLVGLFVATALHQLGFNLGVILGAAGILTVAVGFAAQTSASNFISGLFLIAERPFSVGDIVQVEDVTGVVLSVDLLSMKLRTFDNILVRLPNEMLIKSKVRTLTRFPIRRLDLPIDVAYKEDLERVREVLFRVADRNPLSLEEPEPLLILLGFGDSGVNLQFSVWAAKDRFLALRNSIMEEIKRAFDDEGIEIPFPHRSLYAGAATEPLPIRLVDGAPADGGAEEKP